MAAGIKTGGRSKGTPNRKTQEVTEILERMDFNPIEKLIQIASGQPVFCRLAVNTDQGDFVEVETVATLDQQLSASKELAQYVYPKRKAMELSGPDGSDVPFPTSIRIIHVAPGDKI